MTAIGLPESGADRINSGNQHGPPDSSSETELTSLLRVATSTSRKTCSNLSYLGEE